jgi:predicted kinase
MAQELTSEYLYADRIARPHAIIMVGVPRCGKTTKVQELVKRGYTPVCRDDIRRALGVRFDKDLEKEVHKIDRVMLEALIIRGVPIVVDETNVTKHGRKQIIDLIRKHNGVWSFIEVQTPPIEELKRRCTDTNMPWNIVEGFIDRFESVQDDELCGENLVDITGIIIPKIVRIIS